MDLTHQTPSAEIPFKRESVRPLTQEIIAEHCTVELQKTYRANDVKYVMLNPGRFLFLQESGLEGRWIHLGAHGTYNLIPEYNNENCIMCYRLVLSWCHNAKQVSLHSRRHTMGSAMELKVMDTQNQLHVYRVDREHAYRILPNEIEK